MLHLCMTKSTIDLRNLNARVWWILANLLRACIHTYMRMLNDVSSVTKPRVLKLIHNEEKQVTNCKGKTINTEKWTSQCFMETNSSKPSAPYGPSRPHSYRFLLNWLLSMKTVMCTGCENRHHWLLTHCFSLSRDKTHDNQSFIPSRQEFFPLPHGTKRLLQYIQSCI